MVINMPEFNYSLTANESWTNRVDKSGWYDEANCGVRFQRADWVCGTCDGAETEGKWWRCDSGGDVECDELQFDLDLGKPVRLSNGASDEDVVVRKDGTFSVGLLFNSAAMITLDCK
jgi:hypothetical protein